MLADQLNGKKVGVDGIRFAAAEDPFLPALILLGLTTAATRFWSRCEQSQIAVVLRLRPDLILASRVLPSTPPLFQSVERHFFEGQFGGFSVSGI